MDQRALARAAGADDRQHFPLADFKINATQDLSSAVAIAFIGEADSIEADTLRKAGKRFRAWFLGDDVLGIHELK